MSVDNSYYYKLIGILGSIIIREVLIILSPKALLSFRANHRLLTSGNRVFSKIRNTLESKMTEVMGS
jgi:hypothetical protein